MICNDGRPAGDASSRGDEPKLSPSFDNTMALMTDSAYQTEQTGSQLYVSVYGETVLDFAVGCRAEGSVMTSDTKIIWLCCSKPTLLIALFRAFADAGISEDDPVASVIPEFANAGKGDVTFAHVLTYTVPFSDVGLSWTDDQGVLDHSELEIMKSPWDVGIKMICEMPLFAQPGKVVTYTGVTSWMLLAEVLERLTGRPHEETVREQVLDPLGMDCTGVYVTEQNLEAGECAPLWDLTSEKPQIDPIDTRPLVFARWPGVAVRGPARDMARPLECAAGWRGRGILEERWRDGLVSPRRFEIGDPWFNGAGIWWSLGMVADPVGFGLSLSSQVAGHTGERSSVVFAELNSGITFSFLSNGLPSRPADNLRKRNLIRAVYKDLSPVLAGS